MNLRRNLLIGMSVLIIMPFVAGQMSVDLGDALDNGFRAFFDMMQGTYVKLGLTVIFMIILLANIFSAGLSKVTVFGGSGGANKYGRIVSVSLAILSTMGIIFLGPGGPLNMVERVLETMGWFGGFAIAMLTFGLVYMNLKGEKKSWPLTFMSTGIGMIVYGMLMNGKSWFSFGWLFLLLGIIWFILEGNSSSSGKEGGLFSNLFGKKENKSDGGREKYGTKGRDGRDPETATPEKVSGVSAQKRYYGSELRLYVAWNKTQATEVEKYQIRYWNHNRLSSKRTFEVYPAQLTDGMKVSIEFPIKDMTNPMLKIRAIGKNGKTGAWSDKVLATAGGDPDGPAVNDVMVINEDDIVSLCNQVTTNEMPTLKVIGVKFTPDTTIALQDGKNNIRDPMIGSPEDLTDTELTVKLRQPIPIGTYQVLPMRDGRPGKSKATIIVTDSMKDFISRPDPSRVPRGTSSTTIQFHGAKMHEVIRGRVAVRGLIGATIGGLAGNYEALFTLINTFWTDYGQYVRTGLGTATGAAIGGALSIAKVWTRYPRMREMRQQMNLFLSRGNRVIPIPRNLAGGDTTGWSFLAGGSFRSRILPMINDPELSNLINDVDFLLNPEMFIMATGKSRKIVDKAMILFAGYSVSNVRDPAHPFRNNYLTIVLAVDGDYPEDDNEIHFWVKTMKNREQKYLGMITIDGNIGAIHGNVIVQSPSLYGGQQGGARNITVRVI